MSREAIDQMWQRAMRQSIEDNEMLARYHFDALVRADEREQGQKWFDAVTAQHKAAILAERLACANKAAEFARKWWSIHCDSNKHMETTRKAHDDFCALQAAIRARGETNE
jgi:hypothetical protein